MNTRILIILFMLSGYLSFAQDEQYTISGTVDGLSERTIWVQSYMGYISKRIDSVKTDKNGFFELTYTPPYTSGMIRVQLRPARGDEAEKAIDFAVEKEISFTTNNRQPFDSLKIQSGDLNRDFLELQRVIAKSQEKEDVLEEAMLVYANDKVFYRRLNKAWKQKNKDRERVFKHFYTNHGDKNFSDLVKVIEEWQQNEPFEEETRSNYWENKNLKSPVLLHWNFVSQRVLSYFNTFYANPENFQQALRDYKAFVDLSLKPLEGNPAVFENTLDFLIAGFEQMGATELLEYIDERYFQDGLCDDSGHNLTEKMEAFRALKPGAKAPEFNTEGISLNTFTAEHLLLLFYSPECSHCRESMTHWMEVTAAYKSDKIQVFAIALEEGKGVHTATKMTEGAPENWTTISLKDGDIPDMYRVRATPTFFLLDKNRNIESRLRYIEDIDAYLSKKT